MSPSPVLVIDPPIPIPTPESVKLLGKSALSCSFNLRENSHWAPFAKQHGKTDLDRSFQKDGYAHNEFAKKKWLGTIRDAKYAIRKYRTDANRERKRRGLSPILISVGYCFYGYLR